MELFKSCVVITTNSPLATQYTLEIFHFGDDQKGDGIEAVPLFVGDLITEHKPLLALVLMG